MPQINHPQKVYFSIFLKSVKVFLLRTENADLNPTQKLQTSVNGILEKMIYGSLYVEH